MALAMYVKEITGYSYTGEKVEKLIERYGIGYLETCTVEELGRTIGIDRAEKIKAALELGKAVYGKPHDNKISTSDVAALAAVFMAEMRYLKNEQFQVLLLNSRNQIIGRETVSTGSVNQSLTDPREVFRPAIIAGAAAVAFAHNHPSGNPEPSSADIEVTKRLIAAAKILNFNVLDHIIIGDGIYESIRSSNPELWN